LRIFPLIEAVRRAAFDGVVMKPLTDPFVRKLADFVRNKRSQQRDTYVRLIATIALNTNLDQNEFNQGFTTPEQASAAALRDKEKTLILEKVESREVMEGWRPRSGFRCR